MLTNRSSDRSCTRGMIHHKNYLSRLSPAQCSLTVQNLGLKQYSSTTTSKKYRMQTERDFIQYTRGCGCVIDMVNIPPSLSHRALHSPGRAIQKPLFDEYRPLPRRVKICLGANLSFNKWSCLCLRKISVPEKTVSMSKNCLRLKLCMSK